MEPRRNSIPIDLWIDEMTPDEAEETLRRLVRNSPGFFFRCKNDEHWTMQVLSGHFENITGFQPDDLVGDEGLQFADLIVDADRDHVREAIDSGLSTDGRFQVSYRIETAAGETCWLLEHGTGTSQRDDGYTHIEGFVSDITREKTLEHRLRHSQKLEVIGRLAGGVAHDFNNILSVILGYGSLALEQLEDDNKAREDLHEVIEAADRAKDLSGQILSFSRYQANAPDVVELDQFLRDKISMIARSMSAGIQLEQHLDAGDARVEIERTQLEQVLLNLATNARDAMEDQPGTLRIASRVETFSEPDLPYHHLDSPGEYAVIDFEDEGEGIPEPVRAKLFEPFYTTKSREKGTGLGLATSSGIISSAGGSIWFDTEVGEGTTFHVALPTTDREPIERPTSRPKNGRSKILVIDDDAKVRDLIARLLRSQDINTFTAESAKGARHLWSAEGGFDLIVADLILPDTNGITLVNSLLSPSDTDVPVLFLSGYTGEDVDQTNVVARHVRFFKKPFTPESLRRAVTEMLGLDEPTEDR